MTEDFSRFLSERGLKEVPEAIRSIYESERDQIGFPCPIPVAVRRSSIDGLGLFATTVFEAGKVIAPMRLRQSRTPAGRYANHCDRPNTSIFKAGESVYLKAARRISVDEEITVDYRQVLKEGH